MSLASCDPSGDTGDWWAASGASDGAEQWAVDLSAYAGSDVEVSISYASDDSVQGAGVFVDDVVVSNGPGTTSFEADGDDLDGWSVPGAPAGSAPNANDWIAGTLADLPPTIGQIAEGSLARQEEIIDFLADNFGSVPLRLGRWDRRRRADPVRAREPDPPDLLVPVLLRPARR